MPPQRAAAERSSTDAARRVTSSQSGIDDLRVIDQAFREEYGPRFSVAVARAAGVSYRALRGMELDAPFHGTRTFASGAEVDEDLVDRFGATRGPLERTHLARARAYEPRMGPNEFFSHVTAAVLWGIPLPPAQLRDERLHVGVFAPARLPRGRGIRGHQLISDSSRLAVEPRTGFIVSDPASTWATLGAVLKHPYDLVAAGDGVVRSWRSEPLAGVEDLAGAIRAGRRVGIVALRAALPYIRTSAASRPESWMRLTLIDAGLPEPEANFDVIVDGDRIAAVDLAYAAERVAIEYEGEHHLLDPKQWASDIQRYERLRAAGWAVIQVTKTDLFDNPGQIVRRVRAAIVARA